MRDPTRQPGRLRVSVSTNPALKPNPPTGNAPPEDPFPPAADIRAGRSYILSRSPLRSAGRRLASVLTLAGIDVSGVALGLYGALALRELWHGRTESSGASSGTPRRSGFRSSR